jgi:integrase/recombinase XerD
MLRRPVLAFDIINLERPATNLARPASGDAHTQRLRDEEDMLVNARTDSEIARAYLYHAELAPTTLKNTKTELARFLLWCKAANRTLQTVHVEDLTTYKAWLLDPQPVDRWISATRWPRADPRWRPFSGPLSPPSARQAFRTVKALMTFAANAGYLQRNAASLVKNIKTAREARITRYLGVRAIDYVYAALERQPTRTTSAKKAAAREKFLFLTFITTGARLAEIVAAPMGALYAEDDGRWWFDVIGKGSKPRRLPVSQEVLDAYQHYRAAYSLPALTSREDHTPLVLNTRGQKLIAVTDEAASKAVKGLFAHAAELAISAGDVDAANALRNASTHWLRHTMLTTHANNNVPLKTLQDTAGHASLSTTATYLHKTDRDRHDEILSSLEHPDGHVTRPNATDGRM